MLKLQQAKEGKMAEVDKVVAKYRILYQDEAGYWQVKVCCSKQEASCWQIGHPGSIFLVYVMVTSGGNRHYDSKEEAIQAAKEEGEEWTLLHPGKHLSSEAIMAAYRA